MVSVGCRHPRTVPLAFRVSAQFDGLALVSVPTWQASPPSWALWRPTNSTQLHRRTRGACRPRLGSLPAHTASRAHPRHPNPLPLSRPRCGPALPVSHPLWSVLAALKNPSSPSRILHIAPNTFADFEVATSTRNATSRSMQVKLHPLQATTMPYPPLQLLAIPAVPPTAS